MIDYIIKINYILSYSRYEKLKRFSPEDTCLVLTDLEMGNIGLLSIYFTTLLYGHFHLIGNEIAMYAEITFLCVFYLWGHCKIEKKIRKLPVRKSIKKMPEEMKKKYSRLSLLYFIITMLSWLLSFTWRVIIYGEAAMG